MDEYYVLVLWDSYCDDCGADRTYNGPLSLKQAEELVAEVKQLLLRKILMVECIICKKHSINRKE